MVTSSELLLDNLAWSRDAFIFSRPSFDKDDVTDLRSTSSGNKIQRLCVRPDWWWIPVAVSTFPRAWSLILSGLKPLKSNIASNSSSFVVSSSCFSVPPIIRTLRSGLKRSATVAGLTPGGSLKTLVNSPLSNPFSCSHWYWPCKIIFSLSTSSEISSGW